MKGLIYFGRVIAYRVLSQTPGGRHVWIETSHGRLRKPVEGANAMRWAYGREEKP